MKLMIKEQIMAPRQDVWRIITDFENITQNISAITESAVLHRPKHGLEGLKWEETRIMFGKSAKETMWITSAEENHWYETRAESYGSIYQSRLQVTDHNDGTELSMSFDAIPQTLGARFFGLISFLFAGSLKKALAKDLSDIKTLAESRHA